MLKLENISVRFDGKPVLSGCSLSLGGGERLAIMGPSGCGKTTLLRVALSLQPPDTGSVSADVGRSAAVFQEPRLLPWRTAAENVNVVLSDTPETMPEALSMLERVELSDAGEKYPSELSGGMQQRVSIARALAYRPDLLVLDEPFRGLDEELRGRIVSLLSASLPSASLLLATHSEEEALSLGCRILRYRDGRFV
ncbi:MAG: ABC transporter ATP-binding protein [Oscillospiraceae bacterium]|nr:ABC transporter ATP-binding protein [Oscillospiraceae bacterium]